MPKNRTFTLGHAVVLAAGLGGEPLGDLGLHHHHHGADRRELGQQVQQRGHGDVVGQVGHHRGRQLGQVGPLDAEDVLVEHRQPVDLAVRVLGDGLGQALRQDGIDLDGGHRRAAVQQRQRQRAEAGPDLEDVVMLLTAGRGNDPADGVGVVDEVLSERLTRPEVEFLGQVSDLSAPEQTNCHRCTSFHYTGHAPQP